jgi:hypothetical protein
MIVNSGRFHQKLDFSETKIQGKQFTDIDAILDYGNKGWVLVECKVKGNPLPYGQKLALERMVNDFAKAEKPALLVVAEHETPINEDIRFEETKTNLIYFNGKWRNLDETPTTYVIDYFLRNKCM